MTPYEVKEILTKEYNSFSDENVRDIMSGTLIRCLSNKEKRNIKDYDINQIRTLVLSRSSHYINRYYENTVMPVDFFYYAYKYRNDNTTHFGMSNPIIYDFIQEYKNNKPVMIGAMKINPRMYKNLSPELKMDKDIVSLLSVNTAHFIPENYLEDEDVLVSILKNGIARLAMNEVSQKKKLGADFEPSIYQVFWEKVPESLKNDKLFLIKALEINKNIYEFIPKSMKNDVDILTVYRKPLEKDDNNTIRYNKDINEKIDIIKEKYAELQLLIDQRNALDKRINELKEYIDEQANKVFK